MKRISMAAILGVVLLAAAFAGRAEAQTISASIDASHTGPPISKYMYGQFLEHLRNTINTGIWAEMLEDRKFFNPINSRPTPQRAGRGRGGGGAGFAPRRWMPIGPDDSVTMDTADPYVGDHSPMIHAGSDLGQMTGAVKMWGIHQDGLAVRKGMSYIGHIVLAGDAAAKVSVSLSWGNGVNDRQTIPLENITSDYVSYPLSFTALADSDNASLQIFATGNGTFHVGAVSLMPADNVQGFRKEVVAQLAQLHSGVYRFPGGNYISNYEWRDAVGPRDKRPPTWDYAWNAVQPNDVGLDEFMVLFKLLDVEPYITINAGFGDEWSARQLVEYANGAATTPMGAWRAANGHAEPYGIKLWGVGNEMYGDWQLGVMPLDQYEKKHNIFAAAMKKVDPTIKLIASGAMPDEMTVTLQGKRLDGQVLTGILSRADWTGGMLTHCLANIDMVSEHCYCTSGQGFDMAAGAYVNVNEPLVDWARRPANRVRAKYEAYEEYLKRIPGLAAKPVPISVDEYSYRGTFGTRYRPALAYAYQFDEMFRHTDVFQMAAFTFATSCLSANRTDAVLNPVGLVFKLYRDHFGTLPVEVSGNSPQPGPKYPVGGDQPKVNAGSATYPLDVCSALSDDRKTLTVAVVNPTETSEQLEFSVSGVDLTGSGHVWRMAPSSLDATILVGQKPQVAIEDEAVDFSPSVTVKPISISIYEFGVK